MRKQFSLKRNNAILNFSSNYCTSSEEIIDSKGFRRVLVRYIQSLHKKQTDSYLYVKDASRKREVVKDLKVLCKLLLTLSTKEIISYDEHYGRYFKNPELLSAFIEDFYNYWRKIERYTIVLNKYYGEGLQKHKFMEANQAFSNLILQTYRKIIGKLSENEMRVYRQLAAGGNAGIVLNRILWPIPKSYSQLKGIPFVESIILNPPFITYPKQTTRKGFFEEVDSNPLNYRLFDTNEWFCYPAKIGKSLAYIYFHKDFISLGVPLCNLFELAPIGECRQSKPDIIFTFGYPDEVPKTVYYCDREEDLLVGYVSYDEQFDYFGYMKKMALTLHNIRMIEQGHLPIHGAMVNVTLKNKKQVNIVIIGDSGAGKSESLEALRSIGDEYITDMKVIFDDMGSFNLENGKLKAYGTEIGAFIRLDDLENGYAYREIDRSIFMNPDKTNARVVIPISSYKDISCGHRVDLVFYANNYEDGQKIELFKNQEEAINVFKLGRRKAKGTTSEDGIVDTFFANPFGPYQRQEETEHLLNQFFSYLFENNIPVGQLRTCLGIDGFERTGPKEVATELLKYIQKPNSTKNNTVKKQKNNN